MRKRSKLAQNKADQHDYNPNDIVSRLPDDILVSILSKLPLKDAAGTSLLARRWRYMWCQTTRLELEDNETMFRIGVQPELRFRERNKYINWVNRIMTHHTSGSIEEFKIFFDLDKHSKGAITKWIEFAISKNVKRLELNLVDTTDDYFDPLRNFVFPNKILDRKLGISVRKNFLNVSNRVPSKMIEIKFLKSLILRCVNINDDALEKFLKNCPVLDNLYIYNSFHLKNLKICGPALALTRVEILYCLRLESLELSDSNVTWFKYLGTDLDLKLGNNPRLKMLSIGEGYSGMENNMFKQISSCTPYLEVLELDMYRPKQDMHRHSYPMFPKVKNLKMIVGAWNDDNLLGLTWVANACPNLQKFTIQLNWKAPVRIMRPMRTGVRHIHRHLEQVEIKGFYGRLSDIELALYFRDTCIALKEMVVDPTCQMVPRQNPLDNESLMQESLSRYYADTILRPRFTSRPNVNVRIL